MLNIIVIGGGWYGCHISNLLKKTHNVRIIEKNSELFNNSSYYNQNRLHYGYHYPRDYKTRQLCKQNYEKFINEYNFCVDDIEKNYYIISKDSILDYDTYLHIYKYENYNFKLIQNENIQNIQGEIFHTNEKVINSDKIKSYFKSALNTIPILYNVTIEEYKKKIKL